MRVIAFLPLLLLLGAGGLACDTGARGTPQVAVQAECTAMPVECPATLACEVSTVEEDGAEVRVCGGTSCCQAFCEQNGCGRCCATPAR